MDLEGRGGRMLRLVGQIMGFCGAYARRIRLAWVFSFLKSLCANTPLMLSVIVVNGLVDGSLTAGMCVGAAVFMGLLLILQSVFQHTADRLQASAGYEIFADKRLELAEHLRRLPMGYFNAGNIGKISSILSADMVFIEEQSMMILADVASCIFAQAIITVFLFYLHPVVGAVALATELVAIAVAQPMNREALANSARRQDSIEVLTGALIEYIDGAGIIRGFNRTGAAAADLHAGFAQMTESNLAFEAEHAPWERALLVIYAFGMTGIIAASLQLFESGALSGASFIGVTIFAFNVFAPLRALYQLDSRITIMRACLDRLQAVFAEPELADRGSDRLLENAGPEIEFRDVSFAYSDEDVLHNVGFSAERGQTVALVGQSGSGKTTVANLLARFWDCSDGCICMRGIDIRTLSLAELMDRLSMVFQRVYLFEDTVYNNIAMGRPDATEKEVHTAARKARCHDFIMELPYGYNTVIGEGGSTLSGGEAQRISLARCILKDAPIVILDEATANIDADNENAIQAAMTELCRDKTVIVIAHKLHTIASADKIIVLDAGRVAEAGTHGELLARGGAYARMVAAASDSGTWSGGAGRGE